MWGGSYFAALRMTSSGCSSFAALRMTNGGCGNFMKAVDLGCYLLVRQHLPVLVILSAAKELGVGCWLQRHRSGEQKASSFAALRMTTRRGRSFAARRMTAWGCGFFMNEPDVGLEKYEHIEFISEQLLSGMRYFARIVCGFQRMMRPCS
jgi:hypothetical protein